jgi:hypothetical protein
MATFQKFGAINQIFVRENLVFILYHQNVSAYLAMKVMNEFHVNDKIRLKVRICNE